MPNPFVHVELTTDDLSGARKFYGALFTWKVAAAPHMPTYLMIDTGKKATGGGMQPRPMPEAPTAWLPYVEVADVKKTLAKAKKLGGAIVVDAQPVGAMGVIGVFSDPRGAMLGVWSAAPKKKRAPKKTRR